MVEPLPIAVLIRSTRRCSKFVSPTSLNQAVPVPKANCRCSLVLTTRWCSVYIKLTIGIWLPSERGNSRMSIPGAERSDWKGLDVWRRRRSPFCCWRKWWLRGRLAPIIRVRAQSRRIEGIQDWHVFPVRLASSEEAAKEKGPAGRSDLKWLCGICTGSYGGGRNRWALQKRRECTLWSELHKLVTMCAVVLAACATATHPVCFVTTQRQTRLFTKAALSKKNCRDHVSGAGTAPAPIPYALWNNT